MTVKNYLAAAVFIIIITLITIISIPSTLPAQKQHSAISTVNDYIVRGNITWTDNDNNDGLRPYALNVSLMQQGEIIDTASASVVYDWMYEFTSLPEPSPGNPYHVELEPVTGYEITCSEPESDNPRTYEYDFTAIHTQTVIQISGSITWDDDNNRDGIRPESVTVDLLSDRKKRSQTDVTAADGWTFHFDGLAKYDKAREISYSIEAYELPGYEMISGDLAVTYRHIPETTTVNCSLQFDDGNNQDSTRPEEIRATLRNGTKAVAGSVLSASTGWKCSFTDIPKNEAGKPIPYTVEIPYVDGYTKSFTDEGFLLTKNVETISVSGSISWNDDDNSQGARPETVQVILYADNAFIKSVTTDADSGWKYSFQNLPRFHAGTKIRYTISQSDIPGYDPSINGLNITNTIRESAIHETEIESETEKTATTNVLPVLPLSLTGLLLAGFVLFMKYKTLRHAQ